MINILLVLISGLAGISGIFFLVYGITIWSRLGKITPILAGIILVVAAILLNSLVE